MPNFFCTYHTSGALTSVRSFRNDEHLDTEKVFGHCWRDFQAGKAARDQFRKVVLRGGQEQIVSRDKQGRWWAVNLFKIPSNSQVVCECFQLNAEPAELSERERQILALICNDQTNTEIATLLGISRQNLSNALKKLRRKLNCRTNYGLVKVAIALNTC